MNEVSVQIPSLPASVSGADRLTDVENAAALLDFTVGCHSARNGEFGFLGNGRAVLRKTGEVIETREEKRGTDREKARRDSIVSSKLMNIVFRKVRD